MSSASKRRIHYFWSCLLCLTIAICVLLLYISQAHKEASIPVSLDLSAAQSEQLIGEECRPTCITKECILHSNFLITTMKPEVDPCDNFYTYACGNYKEKFDEDEVNSIVNRNHRKMVIALKDVLDNIEADPGTASWKLKSVYDSCMKVDSENEALPEALNFLNGLGIGPGWPILARDFKFQTADIATILGKLLAYNECPVMEVKMDRTNAKAFGNGKKNITITINEDIFLQRNEPESVREKFLDILEEFDLSSEDSEITEELWFEFLRIHRAMHMLRHRRSSMTVGATDAQIDCFENSDPEWKYFCDMLESFMNETTWRKELNENHARIPYPYIHFVKHVIPELKHFTDRNVANYLAIHFFWTHGMDLNASFRRNICEKHLRYKPLQPPNTDRWEYCVNWLATNMYLALGHEFTKKVLPKEAFGEISTLLSEYITEIVNSINEQDWITENVKEGMTAEIRNIKSSQDTMLRLIFNETIVNEAYKEFNFTNENYFKNVLQHRLYSLLKTEEIFKDFSEIPESPFQVNAEWSGDEVGVLFGMLFPPHYLYGLQRFINVITLGSVIAHEIGHNVYFGFYNFKNEEDNRTFVDFEKRISCLKKQYSDFNFHSLDRNLPGDKYEGETFPDHVKIAVVDKIIEKYASTKLALPGSHFTTEQLLYISLAQTWCSKSNIEEDEYYRVEKNHPPSRFRVLGPLQSSKKFARTFNCTTGSYMNPANKCLAFD